MALDTKCNHMTSLRFKMLTQCGEWSEFMVEYFFVYVKVTYFSGGFIGHQIFLATADDTL